MEVLLSITGWTGSLFEQFMLDTSLEKPKLKCDESYHKMFIGIYVIKSSSPQRSRGAH